MKEMSTFSRGIMPLQNLNNYGPAAMWGVVRLLTWTFIRLAKCYISIFIYLLTFFSPKHTLYLFSLSQPLSPSHTTFEVNIHVRIFQYFSSSMMNTCFLWQEYLFLGMANERTTYVISTNGSKILSFSYDNGKNAKGYGFAISAPERQPNTDSV